MNYDELVQEIVARVSAYLEKDEPAKKKVIVLTATHGESCHTVLECPVMNEHFKMECALSCNYDCNLDDCEGIVMFELSNAELSKIASGNCDTPYSKLAQKALLMGKPIWVPKREIEILQYEANTPYARMMLEKLELLKSFGVVLTSYRKLANTILGEGSAQIESCDLSTKNAASPAVIEFPSKQSAKEVTVSKKVLTERDIANARHDGVSLIRTGAKSIVTDLAKEYALSFGIEIIKG